MRNSYDVIEIDNDVIFNTLQNFYFWELYIFVYQVGLKHAEPIWDQYYTEYKISHCKKFHFLPKKNDFK